MILFIRWFSKLTILQALYYLLLSQTTKNNKEQTSPKVLVAPLDWGLGHATRCIPVIKELLRQGCDVLVACEGRIKLLLEKEFPQLIFLNLSGYKIKYTKNSRMLAFGIVAQIPKILSAIASEKKWLAETIREHSINAVISDNRYGLVNKSIPSAFITHQLLIKAPLKKVESYLQKFNYQYINQFSECWVPDAAGDNNLAGVLSHPAMKPNAPLHYIGALSRFANAAGEEKHLLILLSGPEPQRTVFEKLIVSQLQKYKERVVLVRGIPGEKNNLSLPANVSVYNHLPADELKEKMLDASFIVSRCGYSTVMDIAALKKKSILIPTPGQTEQEYLATHLSEMNFALCIDQKKIRLKQALELASSFNYQFGNYDDKTALSKTVKNFIRKIKAPSETSIESIKNPVNPRL